MIIFELEQDGNYVAVRPSGTEPKVKFYMFAYDAPQSDADLVAVKAGQTQRLETVERDFRASAGA